MSSLITEPNIVDPDTVYQCLIDMHAGRSSQDSHRVNAKLILTLVNHIGDEAVIRKAIAMALESEIACALESS